MKRETWNVPHQGPGDIVIYRRKSDADFGQAALEDAWEYIPRVCVADR